MPNFTIEDGTMYTGDTGVKSRILFKEGTGVTFNITGNQADGQVEVEVAAEGGGGAEGPAGPQGEQGEIGPAGPAGEGGGGGETVIDSGTLAGLTTKTISAIAGTFKDLRLVVKLRSEAATEGPLYVGINADTADANYLSNSVENVTLRVASNRSVSGTPTSAATAGMFAVLDLEILDYALTAAWKNIQASGVGTGQSDGTALVSIHTSLTWKNTAAVTALTFFNANGDNWAAGSTYALYGRG